MEYEECSTCAAEIRFGGYRGKCFSCDVADRAIELTKKLAVTPAVTPGTAAAGLTGLRCRNCSHQFQDEDQVWALLHDGEKYLMIGYIGLLATKEPGTTATKAAPYCTGCAGALLDEMNDRGYSVDERIQEALQIAWDAGMVEGDHHKMWVIDQMVRALTACPRITATAKDARGATYNYDKLGESEAYKIFINQASEDDPPWDEGIAP